MSWSHRYTSAKRVPHPRDRDSFCTNTNSPKFLCLQSPRKYGTGPGSNLQPLSLTANTGVNTGPIISTVIFLPSAESFKKGCCQFIYIYSYKQKYVQEVLVNCLLKLAQEKSVVR